MTRSPPDQSGGRYGGGLTILEFFAEPCGAPIVGHAIFRDRLDHPHLEQLKDLLR
jgi:hypothetical protein